MYLNTYFHVTAQIMRWNVATKRCKSVNGKAAALENANSNNNEEEEKEKEEDNNK